METVSYTKLFLEDFTLHFWPLSSSAKRTVENGWKRLYLFLTIDFIWSHFIITPLNVAFWRAVWTHSELYLDITVFKGDIVLANVIAIVVGLAGTTPIFMLHNEIRVFAGQPGNTRHTFISRCFSIWFGFFNLYLWRGVYDLIFYYHGLHKENHYDYELSLICLAIGTLGLTITGTSHSGLNSPVLMSPDLTESHISACTMLDSDQNNSWSWRFLDAIITNIITMLSILSWYGLWEMEDLELEGWWGWTHLNSSIATVLLGMVLDLIIIFLHYPLLILRHKANKNQANSNHIFALTQVLNSVKGFLSTFASCSSFRGWWYLWDIFYLTENYEASLVTGGIIGATGLMVVGCITSIHGGLVKDSVKQGGITLPCFYITYFFIEDVQKQIIHTNKSLF